MCRLIKNEKGYALLIVLLIITLIAIFIPFLLTSTINGSKQVDTAERSIQLASLQEMGYVYIDSAVKKVIEEIKAEEREENEDEKDRVKMDPVQKVMNRLHTYITDDEIIIDPERSFTVSIVNDGDSVLFTIIAKYQGEAADPETGRINITVEEVQN